MAISIKVARKSSKGMLVLLNVNSKPLRLNLKKMYILDSHTVESPARFDQSKSLLTSVGCAASTYSEVYGWTSLESHRVLVFQ